MTTHQARGIAQTIISQLPESSLQTVRHYLWLQDNQAHRPDYSLLMNALKASDAYAGLDWVMSNIEIACIEWHVLDLVSASWVTMNPAANRKKTRCCQSRKGNRARLSRKTRWALRPGKEG